MLSPRSTLKLDLKNFGNRRPAPHIGRIGLVIVSIITIVTTIASINSPSASTAMVVHYDPVKSEDLIGSISAPAPSDTTRPDTMQTFSTLLDGADDTSGFAGTKGNKPLVAQQPPSVSRRPQIRLAAFAPSLPDRPVSATPSPLESAVSTASINKSATVKEKADDFDILFESAGNPLAAEDQGTDGREWLEEEVQKRDTLSKIFYRLGLDSKEAYALAKLKGAEELNTIQPGQKIQVAKTVSGEDPGQELLDQLRFSLNRFDTLLISRQGDSYEVSEVSREPVIEYQTVSAEINSSLHEAATDANLPSEFVYGLASIFGWQVDFAKNLQPGDSFSIVYEQLLLDDKVVGYGQIVAAELVTSGKKLQAVRHVDEQNRVSYFSPDGEGMQGSFLRSPIKFARVTSKFTKRRLHPIQKTWKAHKGVDYGAPMNTPIRATGDGVVKMVGKNRGYGNVVVLQHGRKVETLYAHMNKFKKGLKRGSQIKQGDIIGYVGKTGWATGPHVHYEFRTNGKHRDPLTVELPGSPPINDKYRKQFLADAGKWVTRLEQNGRLSLAENAQQ